jgi:hypothetical protein
MIDFCADMFIEQMLPMGKLNYKIFSVHYYEGTDYERVGTNGTEIG